MLARRIKAAALGTKKYSGDDIAICRQIIEDCWNGSYFKTSAGHFEDFFTRDFSWCCESLISLGHRGRVRKSLVFALNAFKRHGSAATTIKPDGKAYDFPCYAVDSLPSLAKSMRILGDKSIIKQSRNFIESEAQKFYSRCISPATGLVKPLHFSSMKDHAIRQSSCYDNCMAGMLKDELERLGFENPLKKYDYKKLIMDKFWTGSYFLDDLSGERHIAGDAQVMPFYSGIITSRAMLRKCIDAIKAAGLDKPIPLRYTKGRIKQKFVAASIFAPGYERESCWAHMGVMIIDVLGRMDRKAMQECMEAYRAAIMRYHNFLEVFDGKGAPYKSLFYHADEGMLWASVYLKNKTK